MSAFATVRGDSGRWFNEAAAEASRLGAESACGRCEFGVVLEEILWLGAAQGGRREVFGRCWGGRMGMVWEREVTLSLFEVQVRPARARASGVVANFPGGNTTLKLHVRL